MASTRLGGKAKSPTLFRRTVYSILTVRLDSYYEYLPKGTVKMEYNVRLDNVGEVALPPNGGEAW